MNTLKYAIILMITMFGTASAVPTCNHLVKQSVQYYDNLQDKNITRHYYIYLPASYCHEKKHQLRPVIYGLHGYYGSASGFALSTTQGAFNRLAQRKNLIMVYPQGMRLLADGEYTYSSWNFLNPRYYNPDEQKDYVTLNGKKYPICNVDAMKKNPIPRQPGCRTWNGLCAWTSCYDDPSYLLAIQRQVIQQQQGDPDRQYIVGISNGGMMTYHMACRYPKYFKAAVAIAGTTVRHMVCQHQSRDISLLVLSGVKDKVVPLTKKQVKNAPNNLYYYRYGKHVAQAWGKHMQCQQQHVINNANSLDGIHCIQYSQCKGGNSVAFCTWGNNKHKTMHRGHVYPGVGPAAGYCVNPMQHQIMKGRRVCRLVQPNAETVNATNFIYNFLSSRQLQKN